VSVGSLRDALKLSNLRLREAWVDYEILLCAAMTGKGLQEIRDNQYLQAIVRQAEARKSMPPPLKFPRKSKIAPKGAIHE
jgi:hypothetical protein